MKPALQIVYGSLVGLLILMFVLWIANKAGADSSRHERCARKLVSVMSAPWGYGDGRRRALHVCRAMQRQDSQFYEYFTRP